MAILITFKKKQPTELFYKKRRSQKLRNIHMKTSETPKSPFNSEYFDIFKTTYFEEHLRMTPSQKLNHDTETIKNSS